MGICVNPDMYSIIPNGLPIGYRVDESVEG